jgi:hypothetical protein
MLQQHDPILSQLEPLFFVVWQTGFAGHLPAMFGFGPDAFRPVHDATRALITEKLFISVRLRHSQALPTRFAVRWADGTPNAPTHMLQ